MKQLVTWSCLLACLFQCWHSALVVSSSAWSRLISCWCEMTSTMSSSSLDGPTPTDKKRSDMRNCQPVPPPNRHGAQQCSWMYGNLYLAAVNSLRSRQRSVIGRWRVSKHYVGDDKKCFSNKSAQEHAWIRWWWVSGPIEWMWAFFIRVHNAQLSTILSCHHFSLVKIWPVCTTEWHC